MQVPGVDKNRKGKIKDTIYSADGIDFIASIYIRKPLALVSTDDFHPKIKNVRTCSQTSKFCL